MAKTYNRAYNYKDIDLNVTAHPNTGDVSVLRDEEAVKQAIKVLVFTQYFERPYAPFKGSRIYSMLFENWNPATADIIQEEIRDLVLQYEPRAEIIRVENKVIPEEHSLNIKIYFRMVEKEEEYEVDVVLQE